MKLNSIITIAAIAGFSICSPNAGAQSTTTSADKSFLTNAVMGGEAEVDLANMAQSKASNPKVKALAARIAADHKKANSELMALVTARGIVAPGTDKAHVEVKTRLEKLQGVTFDQAYASAMIDDHMKDIQAFEIASRSGDPAVKEFAQKTLPALREHLKMAQDAKGPAGMPQPAASPTAK